MGTGVQWGTGPKRALNGVDMNTPEFDLNNDSSGNRALDATTGYDVHGSNDAVRAKRNLAGTEAVGNHDAVPRVLDNSTGVQWGTGPKRALNGVDMDTPEFDLNNDSSGNRALDATTGYDVHGSNDAVRAK